MSMNRNHSQGRAKKGERLAGYFAAASLVAGLFVFAAADIAPASDKSDKHGKHDTHKMQKTEKQPETFKATDTVTPIAVSSKARAALSPVYDAYFDIQTSLASDTFELAVENYRQFDSAVVLVDMKLFDGKAHMKWMEFAEKLSESAKLGIESKDISAARKTFESLSLGVIEMERTFGHAGEKEFYLTYCPMAFGRGAYWMQSDKVVNNSYYGAKMLKCGSVKETFSSTDSK